MKRRSAGDVVLLATVAAIVCMAAACRNEVSTLSSETDRYEKDIIDSHNAYTERFASESIRSLDLEVSPDGLIILPEGRKTETKYTQNFERESWTGFAPYSLMDADNVWVPYGAEGAKVPIELAVGEGVGGSDCIKYHKTGGESENIHLYYNFFCEQYTDYKITAKVRSDGKLNPALAVVQLDWKEIAVVFSDAGREWQEISLVFNSGKNRSVRIEWFGGTKTKLYQGVEGMSWLDDFQIVKLQPLPENSAAGHALVTPKTNGVVSPGIFGVQLKFFMETNAIVGLENFQKLLKWLNPKSFRFPGGESAENYHLETRTVENPKWFYGQGSPKGDLNTDRFMEIAKNFNGSKVMVLNYKAWLARGDMEGCFKEAEAWVTYCKDKGYKVEYWEFGNELYLKNNNQGHAFTEGDTAAYDTVDISQVLRGKNPYAKYIEKYSGIPSPKGFDLLISGADYVKSEGDVQVVEDFEGLNGRSVKTPDEGFVEYEFEIPETGLYNLGITYFPIEGRASDIERKMLIDSEIPFDEAVSFIFCRTWVDETGVLKDNRDNDLCPRQVEAPRWTFSPFMDSRGFYSGPLKFYFTKGRHTLRLISVREPMVIGCLRVYCEDEPPTYEQAIKEWRNAGFQEITDIEPIKIQAEEMQRKSHPVLTPAYDRSSPLTEPYSPTKIRLNIIGGSSWGNPGQFLIFLAALQTIPPALYEVSTIEGATPWENFWKVTFPMITPFILTNVVYTVIDSFTSSRNTVMQVIIDTALTYERDLSYSAAMSFIYFGLVAIFLAVVAFLTSRLVIYYD